MLPNRVPIIPLARGKHTTISPRLAPDDRGEVRQESERLVTHTFTIHDVSTRAVPGVQLVLERPVSLPLATSDSTGP